MHILHIHPISDLNIVPLTPWNNRPYCLEDDDVCICSICKIPRNIMHPHSLCNYLRQLSQQIFFTHMEDLLGNISLSRHFCVPITDLPNHLNPLLILLRGNIWPTPQLSNNIVDILHDPNADYNACPFCHLQGSIVPATLQHALGCPSCPPLDLASLPWPPLTSEQLRTIIGIIHKSPHILCALTLGVAPVSILIKHVPLTSFRISFKAICSSLLARVFTFWNGPDSNHAPISQPFLPDTNPFADNLIHSRDNSPIPSTSSKGKLRRGWQ